MTKKTMKLIWDLKESYITLFNYWITTKSWTSEFDETAKKIKLVNVLTKKIEEQARWFLKSKVNYIAWWEYFLENVSSSYSLLHNEISKIMLNIE